MKLLNKVWQDRLQAQAQRIDAMSLRERVFIFLSAAAVLAALLDSFLITPLSAELQTQAATQAKQMQEIKQLREQFVQSSQAGSGESAPQQRLAAALAQQAQLRAQMAQSADPGGGQSPPLSALLSTLLNKHPQLSLVRLELLNEAPPHAAGIALQGLQWQGVELQLAGDYLEQMKYLSQLERSVPGLHWGELRLQRPGGAPSLLQVRLFVLRGTR